MTPEQAAAAKLLELLEEWTGNCDLMDRHHAKVIDKGYKGFNAEKDVYDDINKNYVHPLIARCNIAGFKYVDLMQLIPPGFRTDSVQRQQMLSEFKRWARKEYSLD